MLNKPRCEKAQNLPHKLALFCEGKNLCAHQYHCPQTRQYENTADYSKCTRLPQKEEAKPQTAPVKFVVNVVPKEACETAASVVPEPVVAPVEDTPSTETEAIPTPIYTKNVSPINYGVKKEQEAPAEPEDKTTKTKTTRARKENTDGQVRTTRRRRSKKS